MNKVLKFSKIGLKRRFIQYSIIVLAFIFILFLASKIIQKRNSVKIKVYGSQIEQLEAEKQEKIKLIEKEYDDQIREILIKMEKIRK